MEKLKIILTVVTGPSLVYLLFTYLHTCPSHNDKKINTFGMSYQSSRVGKQYPKNGPSSAVTILLETWKELQEGFTSKLQDLINDGVKEDDPRMLTLIRSHLFPPSSKKVSKLSYGYRETRQAITARKYFNNQVGISHIAVLIDCISFK